MTEKEQAVLMLDLYKLEAVVNVLCELTSEGKADDDIAAMVLVLLDEVRAAQEAIAN